MYLSAAVDYKGTIRNDLPIVREVSVVNNTCVVMLRCVYTVLWVIFGPNFALSSRKYDTILAAVVSLSPPLKKSQNANLPQNFDHLHPCMPPTSLHPSHFSASTDSPSNSDESAAQSSSMGDWGDNPLVRLLTEYNFDKVIRTRRRALVMFYTDYCDYCKTAQKPFMDSATLVEQMNSDVMFAAVDCTHQAGGWVVGRNEG